MTPVKEPRMRPVLQPTPEQKLEAARMAGKGSLARFGGEWQPAIVEFIDSLDWATDQRILAGRVLAWLDGRDEAIDIALRENTELQDAIFGL